MKKRRFTEEEILGILKQAEAGMKATEVCRQNGISNATFYQWREKYGGILETPFPSAYPSESSIRGEYEADT